MNEFYYVTVASGKKFILNFAQYALKSLIKTKVPIEDIYCVVNTKKDFELLKKLIPELINIKILNEDLSKVKWRSHGGKRKYSFFKAVALHKCFTKPIENRYMVYFDSDVLWFKNPEEFLLTKCQKTWFHHGKDLRECSARKSRAGRIMEKSQIDINNYKSLSLWVSQPCAYCMIKRKAKRLPDREAVAGFYILHPKDHEKLLKMTYENCLMVINKFSNHVDIGDQKMVNCALNTLEIDWYGGDRFKCPEHKKYFKHYFGVKRMKKEFISDLKKIGLK